MQTHVYANNQEIACKAAGMDGVSPQAFPDPCWSPPGPAAGPVVIPYPNTCFADSITNGTNTVFICGKEVAIEDQSFFSTSTGNEPATQAFAKGVATGVITGKGYFTQWSFDVVFEGFGVPRHNDMVGHNHGSVPSNTPLFPYVSRAWFSHPCKKEEQRIDRACQPEKDESEAKREIRKNSTLSALLKARRKRNPKQGARRDKDKWHWTDDHCDGLEFSVPDGKTGRAYAQELQEIYKKLPDELNALELLKSELQDMARDAAGSAALKWGGKALLKQAGGSSVPVAGNVIMGIWSAVDAVLAVGDVMEIKRVASESLDKLKLLKSKLTDLQRIAGEFKDFSNLNDAKKLAKAQRLATEGQDMLATLNDCVRARKCNLVPYDANGIGNTFGKRDSKNPSKVESATEGGCCHGQTGHHLVPGGSLKESCPNYDHDAAPTVCVEGTSQYFGSHGRAHQALADEHDALNAQGRITPDGSMSMSDALDAAAKSHRKAFPESNCSQKCIRAQLDSYYQTCRGGRPRMVDANANPIQPVPPSSGDNTL